MEIFKTIYTCINMHLMKQTLCITILGVYGFYIKQYVTNNA